MSPCFSQYPSQETPKEGHSLCVVIETATQNLQIFPESENYKCKNIFKLLASEDQALLVGRNALLVLDLSIDVIDGVRRFDFESDNGLAGEGGVEEVQHVNLI